MIGFIVSKFTDDTNSVMAAEERASMKGLSQAAYAIFRDAQASIEQSPNAGPVGGPPRSRHGQLRRAIRYSVDLAAQSAVIGPQKSMVGTSAEPEEFGGEYKGGYYEPRPFMGPALEKEKNLIPAFWSAEITQ